MAARKSRQNPKKPEKKPEGVEITLRVVDGLIMASPTGGPAGVQREVAVDALDDLLQLCKVPKASRAPTLGWLQQGMELSGMYLPLGVAAEMFALAMPETVGPVTPFAEPEAPVIVPPEIVAPPEESAYVDEGELLELYQAGKLPEPPLPEVTLTEVAWKVGNYWSPRQQKIDPTMMGNSGAESVIPEIEQSFLFDWANEFQHSKWLVGKRDEFVRMATELLGPVAKNVIHNISLAIYNSAAGSDFPSTVFDHRSTEIDRLADALAAADAAEARGISLAALRRVAEWLKGCAAAIRAHGAALEQLTKAQVAPAAEGFAQLGDAGIPPERWQDPIQPVTTPGVLPLVPKHLWGRPERGLQIGAVYPMNVAGLEDWYQGQPPSIYRYVRLDEVYDFDQKPRLSVTILHGPEAGRKVTGLSPSQLEDISMPVDEGPYAPPPAAAEPEPMAGTSPDVAPAPEGPELTWSGVLAYCAAVDVETFATWIAAQELETLRAIMHDWRDTTGEKLGNVLRRTDRKEVAEFLYYEITKRVGQGRILESVLSTIAGRDDADVTPDEEERVEAAKDAISDLLLNRSDPFAETPTPAIFNAVPIGTPFIHQAIIELAEEGLIDLLEPIPTKDVSPAANYVALPDGNSYRYLKLREDDDDEEERPAAPAPVVEVPPEPAPAFDATPPFPLAAPPTPFDVVHTAEVEDALGKISLGSRQLGPKVLVALQKTLDAGHFIDVSDVRKLTKLDWQKYINGPYAATQADPDDFEKAMAFEHVARSMIPHEHEGEGDPDAAWASFAGVYAVTQSGAFKFAVPRRLAHLPTGEKPKATPAPEPEPELDIDIEQDALVLAGVLRSDFDQGANLLTDDLRELTKLPKERFDRAALHLRSIGTVEMDEYKFIHDLSSGLHKYLVHDTTFDVYYGNIYFRPRMPATPPPAPEPEPEPEPEETPWWQEPAVADFAIHLPELPPGTRIESSSAFSVWGDKLALVIQSSVFDPARMSRLYSVYFANDVYRKNRLDIKDAEYRELIAVRPEFPSDVPYDQVRWKARPSSFGPYTQGTFESVFYFWVVVEPRNLSTYGYPNEARELQKHLHKLGYVDVSELRGVKYAVWEGALAGSFKDSQGANFEPKESDGFNSALEWYAKDHGLEIGTREQEEAVWAAIPGIYALTKEGKFKFVVRHDTPQAAAMVEAIAPAAADAPPPAPDTLAEDMELVLGEFKSANVGNLPADELSIYDVYRQVHFVDADGHYVDEDERFARFQSALLQLAAEYRIVLSAGSNERPSFTGEGVTPDGETYFYDMGLAPAEIEKLGSDWLNMVDVAERMRENDYINDMNAEDHVAVLRGELPRLTSPALVDKYLGDGLRPYLNDILARKDEVAKELRSEAKDALESRIDDGVGSGHRRRKRGWDDDGPPDVETVAIVVRGPDPRQLVFQTGGIPSPEQISGMWQAWVRETSLMHAGTDLLVYLPGGYDTKSVAIEAEKKVLKKLRKDGWLGGAVSVLVTERSWNDILERLPKFAGMTLEVRGDSQDFLNEYVAEHLHEFRNEAELQQYLAAIFEHGTLVVGLGDEFLKTSDWIALVTGE